MSATVATASSSGSDTAASSTPRKREMLESDMTYFGPPKKKSRTRATTQPTADNTVYLYDTTDDEDEAYTTDGDEGFDYKPLWGTK